jgi:hypothetical protein
VFPFIAVVGLQFAAAPVAIAATSIPVAEPLMALWDRWQQLVRFQTYNDDEADRLSAMLTEIEQKIAATATTASGLWAKIQVVTHYAETVEGTLSDDLVVSLLADTERLLEPPC